MAESDSDVEFQSADEGEEEEETAQVEQPDTSDQKQENCASKQRQPTEKTEVNKEEGIRTIDESNDGGEEIEVVKEDIKEEHVVDLDEDDINSANNLTKEKQITSNKELESVETIEESPPCAEIESIKESVTETNNDESTDSSVAPAEQMIGRQVEEKSEKPIDSQLNSHVDANPAGGDSERSNLQSPLDRLSENSSKTSGGWGWGGWGKSLISSATSTVSGLGHGLSSAIQSVESSLGVPQPEEIVLEEESETQSEVQEGNESQTNEEKEEEENGQNEVKEGEEKEGEDREVKGDDNAVEEPSSGYSLFSFGASALTGMVGKTVSGGLGALEMIGKKAMDVIQDGDPGLRKKREYFTKSNLPSLSQTLKEAAAVAEKTALKEEEEEERNRAHYGILFDKYQGLSHLEALEILSNQSEGKVHSVMATITGDQLDNLKTQMIEIKDAFELQDMEVEEEDYETATFVDTITEHLFTLSVAATPDKLKRVQREAHEWLARCKQELETMKQTQEKEKEKERNENQSKDDDKEQNNTIDHDVADDKKNVKDDTADDKKVTDGAADDKQQTNDDVADDKQDTPNDEADNKKDKEDDKKHEDEETKQIKQYVVPKEIHVKAIQTLAELTSRCIEQFHKAAELMLLQQAKEHAKNPIQRAASLSKLTSVLCCEVSSLTSCFCEQLTVAADMGEEDDVNPLITNSYLEGSNSMCYIQDAYQLLLPVLQVVAIENNE